MRKFEEFAQVWRGEVIESRHMGVAVVANAQGEVVAGWGDPDMVTYPRSSMKPFQALTLVETGAAEAFRLSPKHLALACASHRGEAHHTELAATWLSQIGCTASDLACGAEYPKHQETQLRMIRAGEKASPLHHNCSGKHTGFLTLCRHCNYQIEGYRSKDHPSQQQFLNLLADLGAPLDMPLGVDGCTLPSPALSLADAARIAARFAAGQASGKRGAAMTQLIEAMGQHPEYVSGSGHPMVAIAKATERRVVFKVGAEAFLLVFLPQEGLGIALKVADGNSRARIPALIAILEELGAITRAESKGLAAIARPVIVNSRQEEVGQIVPASFVAERHQRLEKHDA